MSVQDYIKLFDNLTIHCDMREDCYQTISRFCSGLRSDIRRAMLTISYHVDSIEEAFHLALELELSFRGIFISKAKEHCSKCEGYKHYYQYPSNSRHVNIVPSDNVDDSRVVENVYVLSQITSIIEKTLVNFSILILDEVHVSSEGTIDVTNVLVESSTPIPDDIYVYEDDTSDSKHVLVKSSIPYRLLGIHLPHTYDRG